MNPGHQEEDFIKGSIIDFLVFNLLADDSTLKALSATAFNVNNI